MLDRSSLRCLLQPSASNPVYIQTGPGQYQAVQPHVAQQYQNRYPQTQHQFRQQQMPVRMLTPPNQSRLNFQQQQKAYQMSQGMGPGGPARWHIPQQPINPVANQANNRNMMIPTVNDNFKITLKHQDNKNLPATVTSTIPKSPSPNNVGGRNDAERSLDKFCEDSVKDLMATIAKLDSNGVQVSSES